MAYPEFVPNLIGGREQTALDGQDIAILDPDTGEEIGRLARSGEADVQAAVGAACAAQPAWAAVPGVRRGDILHAIANAIESHADEIAGLVALEAGKRPADARGEVAAAVQCARFFAGEGQRLYGRTTTSNTPGRWAMTVRRPCGIAALITAANTPAPNFAWKVFPALVCGNGVVLKPAEDTPASAWRMALLCEEAGLPRGVLNLVQGIGAEVGPALTGHADVDLISFTGSTRVGREIAAQAGRELKKVSLELGGKNALVVCDDADLDLAVKWSLLSAFSNAGQRCAASSRIIVFDAVYDDFVRRLVAGALALRLGVADDCDLGPVTSRRQLDNMAAAVERAVAGGARLLAGGKPVDGAGFYMPPTLLEGADADAELSCEELFGPVAALYRVADFEAALALANRSPYGLTAAIHTASVDRALSFADRAAAGVVVVNAGTHGSEPHMPFGGLKASGNGTREPGTEALDLYSELRDVYVNTRPERA